MDAKQVMYLAYAPTVLAASFLATAQGLCPKHKELHENGFIALVVPAISPAEGVTHLKVETARSGKYLHIKREVLKNILVNVPAENIELPMLFIDEDAFNWFEQQTNQVTEE